MKHFMTAFMAAFMVTAFVQLVFAEETIPEKAQVVKNDVKRAASKGAHRVNEAFCMEGQVKCTAAKAKHRVEEAADATADKAQELKNKLN